MQPGQRLLVTAQVAQFTVSQCVRAFAHTQVGQSLVSVLADAAAVLPGQSLVQVVEAGRQDGFLKSGETLHLRQKTTFVNGIFQQLRRSNFFRNHQHAVLRHRLTNANTTQQHRGGRCQHQRYRDRQ